ncbi:putative ribonuclease Oy [Trichinella spiralis]|uniref:putative ribonuclease Oy n=1 Tax=Trichinella spiralis TaxID=6334 RepID=UPI0001EFD0F9|nr:putative ribonuclease Oy [Trichinella spiralis]
MVLSVRLSSFCSIENWFIDLRKGKEIPHSPDDSQRIHQSCKLILFGQAKKKSTNNDEENFLHLNWKYSRSKDRWFDGTVGGFSVGGRMCSLHSPGWTNHVKDAFIRHGRMIIIVIMNVKISTNIITIQAS